MMWKLGAKYLILCQGLQMKYFDQCILSEKTVENFSRESGLAHIILQITTINLLLSTPNSPDEVTRPPIGNEREFGFGA